jgi:chaperonin cofactor prefoldin
MSAWKDTMNPHWRTDELRRELERAKERIRQLEAEQRRMGDRLNRLGWKLKVALGEPLP